MPVEALDWKPLQDVVWKDRTRYWFRGPHSECLREVRLSDTGAAWIGLCPVAGQAPRYTHAAIAEEPR